MCFVTTKFSCLPLGDCSSLLGPLGRIACTLIGSSVMFWGFWIALPGPRPDLGASLDGPGGQGCGSGGQGLGAAGQGGHHDASPCVRGEVQNLVSAPPGKLSHLWAPLNLAQESANCRLQNLGTNIAAYGLHLVKCWVLWSVGFGV